MSAPGSRARRLAAILALSVAAAACASPVAAGRTRPVKAFWGPTQVNGASQFPIYHDLGVSIFQTGLVWAEVAPTRPANPRNPDDPAYRWPADVAYAINQAGSQHMRVLLMLSYSPRWANGGQSREWAPTNPKDYADFAYAASKRYPSVHLWMVWGEPNNPANFQPMSPSQPGHLTNAQAAAPKRYARLLDAAYGALKGRSKHNLVIGGNTFTAGDIKPADWVKNMRLPNGKPPRLDLYGHNPFCNRKPDLKNPPSPGGLQDFSDLGRFGKVVDQRFGGSRHRHVPLFLSEFTLVTAPNDSEFNFYVLPKTQASWITSGFKVARSVGAYAFGWIHLYDDAPRSNGAPVSHGGLLDYQGTKKPGYAAFKKG
ncbi:MAG: polysaccharide biosynthesis protein PslG [Thermoleophilaceae bacterium]|nr:polysaccharide biosynthesis protein PslG [Thermoleophilaceae bacterium]